MTGLSSALSSALSGLLTTAGQSAVVSRNVTRASDADYTRKELTLTTGLNGTARSGNYVRSADKNLLDLMLASSSAESSAQVTARALDVLSSTVGDPQDGRSVAAGIMALQQSVLDFQSSPSSRAHAVDAVAEARGLVAKLNAAADAVEKLRQDANTAAKASISNITQLLARLEPVDAKLRAMEPGSDIYAASQDERDAIVKLLSVEVGLRVVSKSDGGIALYTDSGVTLFDKQPRTVELRNASPLAPGVEGASVFIDGVSVTGTQSVLPLRQGQLAAELQVRDTLAASASAQLDEIARSLIVAFSEQDGTAALPEATGAFVYAGSPGLPAAGTLRPGLARDIKLNVAFDDQKGGNPFLLRDGGSNGTAYLSNTSGQSGFQQRLADLSARFDTPFAFDNAAGLTAQLSLKQYATTSASQIEGQRSNSSATLDRTTSLRQHWTQALAGKTGVNLDEEMALLLSLEKSYQASAKVMSTVDQMFATLVGIVR
jgi:flagellar hook-associated protein 1